MWTIRRWDRLAAALLLATAVASAQTNTASGVITHNGKSMTLRSASAVWDRAESRLTTDGEEHHGYGIYYGNWKADYIPNRRAGLPLSPLETEWSPDSSKVLVTKLDERHVAVVEGTGPFDVVLRGAGLVDDLRLDVVLARSEQPLVSHRFDEHSSQRPMAKTL